jgi:hypothetical protein
MKLHSLITLSIFVLFAVLLSACNMPIVGNTTPDPGPLFTQAAQTAEAQPTNTLPVTQPTSVFTQVVPTPTTAVPPTATSTTEPSATPTTAATPTTTATTIGGTCTDQMDFVSDVTVPDDTEMLAGQEFIKTWRLKNTGTCTWTNQYALVFISGDQMNGISPVPLTGSIASNTTVDISANLKAPGTIDTYRGDWQLRNASGVNFGTGTNSNQSFYVQIKVVEGVSELNLGAPTWSDSMDNADNFYLLDTENTKFSRGDGVLEMKSIKAGSSEEWDISTQPSLEDYYLQATFITGDTCSGLDKYGLLTRAPDPDKGYVFEFTCDGHYRLYTWDGKNYNALQEWYSAASIKAGPSQSNVMGIWLKGTTIRLYANGHKIAEFTDDMFDHGQFGLVIGSVNTDNFTVSVDKVEYWKLDQ